MTGAPEAAVPAAMAALSDIRDPERRLMVAHVAALHRPAVTALWLLDEVLGAIVAVAQQPLVGQMRLTWWYDALCALDDGVAARQPVLQWIAAHIVPAGISGRELAGLVDGWEALLEPGSLDESALRRYAEQRGGLLFALVARVLAESAAPAQVQAAGAGWALVDLACHSRDIEAGARAVALATPCLAQDVAGRWPAVLRPLGMMAALARHDAAHGRWRRRRQGAPLRVAIMLIHRLFGR